MKAISPDFALQRASIKAIAEGHQRIINAMLKETMTREDLETLRGETKLYAASVEQFIRPCLQEISRQNIIDAAPRGVIPASEIKPWSPEVAS